jgi:hypothetical protein
MDESKISFLVAPRAGAFSISFYLETSDLIFLVILIKAKPPSYLSLF